MWTAVALVISCAIPSTITYSCHVTSIDMYKRINNPRISALSSVSISGCSPLHQSNAPYGAATWPAERADGPIQRSVYTALVQRNFKNPVNSNRCQRNPERLQLIIHIQIHTDGHTWFQSHHRIVSTCMFPTHMAGAVTHTNWLAQNWPTERAVHPPFPSKHHYVD